MLSIGVAVSEFSFLTSGNTQSIQPLSSVPDSFFCTFPVCSRRHSSHTYCTVYRHILLLPTNLCSIFLIAVFDTLPLFPLRLPNPRIFLFSENWWIWVRPHYIPLRTHLSLRSIPGKILRTSISFPLPLSSGVVSGSRRFRPDPYTPWSGTGCILRSVRRYIVSLFSTPRLSSGWWRQGRVGCFW